MPPPSTLAQFKPRSLQSVFAVQFFAHLTPL